jgi:hypothetical protein
MRRDEDNRRRRILLHRFAHHIQPLAPAFHHQVGHDHVIVLLRQLRRRLGQVVRDIALMSEACESLAHDLRMLALVIDDQDVRLHNAVL